MNKEHLLSTKIRVKTPDESKLLQERLFDLGVTWVGNDKTVKSDQLMFAVSNGGRLMKFKDEASYKSNKEYKEMTYDKVMEPDPLDAEALKEIALMEAKSVTKEETKEKEKMAPKFVFAEKVYEALNIAFDTQENVILHGKGGHGKSEITADFFDKKGIKPFVKTMGAGTTTDTLFGGVDIKEFEKSGKIEYLVENSFMNYEYVVFEELFDAPDYILESLKDILTSKEFRNGTQSFPIKTKLIVCCTNKTREEFSKNDSLKALMERFPLEIKVEWTNYTKVSYNFMFKTLLSKDFPMLEYIMEKLHQAGTTVSPRTAMKVANMMEKVGDSCLDYVAEFIGKNAAIVKQERDKYKNIAVIMEFRQKLSDITNLILKADVLTIDGIKECKTNMKKAETFISQIKTKKCDDDVMAENNRAIEKVTSAIAKKREEMEKILNN